LGPKVFAAAAKIVMNLFGLAAFSFNSKKWQTDVEVQRNISYSVLLNTNNII